MGMESDRSAPWRRNPRLEQLLAELNRLLAPAESSLRSAGASPHLPTLLVIGPPRSGTTLMLQWLAATGLFGYPTNLMSRFYEAPAVGARIQLLLTDSRFAFRDELWDLGQAPDFSSELGKTRGALAPNEFWYFWRRFLPNQELRPLADDEIGAVDGDGLREELAAIEEVLEKPLALKALILQYNLDLLARILPRALFVYLYREPVYNAQSLLQSREKFFGDRDRWYSAKPPRYDALTRLDPFRQVAGQVHDTHRSIRAQLAAIDPARWIRVDYGGFCADPRATYAELRVKLRELGHDLPESCAGPERFESTDRQCLPDREFRRLADACAEMAIETTHP